MAELAYRYGRFRSTDERWDVSWRPTELVDRLIGLRSDPWYLAGLLLWPAHEIARSWDEAGQPEGEKWASLTDAAGQAHMEEFARWLSVDPALSSVGLGAVFAGRVPDPRFEHALDKTSVLFTQGATVAVEEGRLTEALAPQLARVRLIDRFQTVDVPDVRALGAWCLNRLLGSGRQFSLRNCELCGLPWLAVREGGRYCSRPALGHRSTCQAVAAQERYAASHADYSAERRRLGQLVRRGRLGKREYSAWKRDNGPGAEGKDWRRFDAWKQQRKEK